MIEYDPAKGLDYTLAEMQDTPDRIAAVLIALANGDEEGAKAALAGADMTIFVPMLLRVCVDIGLRRYRKEGFADALRTWADKVRALDPHDPTGKKEGTE